MERYKENFFTFLFILHWTEIKCFFFAVQHRQREKDYHQKLAKSTEKEKIDIHTEEDFFKRLDELEVEEELEDEIYRFTFSFSIKTYFNNSPNLSFYNCRLEAEQKKFYGDDLEEGEVYDEEEDLSEEDSDQITTEMIQEELKKLKDIQMGRITNSTLNISSDTVQHQILNTNTVKNEKSPLSANFIQDTLKESCSSELKEEAKDTNTKEKRRISFAEPCVIEDEDNAEEEILISQKACSILKQDDTYENFEEEEEDDTIRIEFSHSSHIPDILESNDTEIKSPIDIYKIFSTPKSILKRSPNDMIYDQVVHLNEDSNTDTEDEDEYVKQSAYSSVSKNNLIILLHR